MAILPPLFSLGGVCAVEKGSLDFFTCCGTDCIPPELNSPEPRQAQSSHKSSLLCLCPLMGREWSLCFLWGRESVLGAEDAPLPPEARGVHITTPLQSARESGQLWVYLLPLLPQKAPPVPREMVLAPGSDLHRRGEDSPPLWVDSGLSVTVWDLPVS